LMALFFTSLEIVVAYTSVYKELTLDHGIDQQEIAFAQTRIQYEMIAKLDQLLAKK
jgi:hypothetical protein